LGRSTTQVNEKGDAGALKQLCDVEIGDRIIEELIAAGLKYKSPRAMWQLGSFILEEHRFPRDYGELIARDSLDSAVERLREAKLK